MNEYGNPERKNLPHVGFMNEGTQIFFLDAVGAKALFKQLISMLDACLERGSVELFIVRMGPEGAKIFFNSTGNLDDPLPVNEGSADAPRESSEERE